MVNMVPPNEDKLRDKKGEEGAHTVYQDDHGGKLQILFIIFSKCHVFLSSPFFFLVTECYGSGLGLPGW